MHQGYYSTGGTSALTRTGQARCEAGSFCDSGVRKRCPSGSYGATPGLSTTTTSLANGGGDGGGNGGLGHKNKNKRCSGLCAAGHYCPEGSTSKTQVMEKNNDKKKTKKEKEKEKRTIN